MRQLRDHVFASTGALLLLAVIQVVLESASAALVYRGQVLPAYGFFPTQIYDFLAKIRFAARDHLQGMPDLPARFLAPESGEHLSLIVDLFPVGVSMALGLGVFVGVLGAASPLRDRRPSARGYLWVWAVLGLLVHWAAALPPLLLEEKPSISTLIYRARSFVVDGTLVALAVFVLSLTLARVLVPALARTTGRGFAASLLAIAIAGGAAVGKSLPLAAEVGAPPPAASPAAPARSRPNVVLISLDSLRADHVGCYGYDRATTPALDRLAAEGVRFSEAISTSSWTLPTHLTMFTSRYQLSHGVVHDRIALSPAVPILGEIMKANGYATAGFVSAPYVAPHYGYARGMDEYVDLSADYGHRREARSEIVSPKLNDLALPWIEKHKDESFFLFVHNFDIHYDYVPPPPYDDMFDPTYDGAMDGTNFIERADVNRKMEPRDLEHVLALYDGEIRFADDHVARIVAKIDELGLRNETLVIVLSDHGDEFFEHGNKGHHRTVYEEVLRVPFIMRLPGKIPAGLVVEEPASLVDLMPTILDLVDIDGPTGMEGRSLAPAVGGARLDRPAIYAEFFDKRGFNLQVARRTRSSKLIQHFNRITHPKRGAIEHYDLASDPLEERDVSGRDLEGERRELGEMTAWLNDRWSIHAELERLAEGGERLEISDDTLERLKSLGYVGE